MDTFDFRDAVGLVWERVDDESGDEGSSEATVWAEGVTGRQWTPTMDGSLEGRAAMGTPVRPRPEIRSWAQASAWEAEDGYWSSSQGWSRSWHSWSEDPWASYLDSRRPDWRKEYRDARGYYNWSETSEAGDSESPPGTDVPLPRLLSRNENKRDAPSPSRAQSRGEEGAVEARGLLRDSAQVREGLASDGAHGLRPELLPLRHDPPQGVVPNGANGLRPELLPLRHDPLQGLGQVGSGVRSKEMVVSSGLSVDQGAGGDSAARRGGESGSSHPSGAGYLRLHSSFPPEFRARPGESWKDYWRAVEFWLASEGVNLPPEVRSSRLMQQLKERAAKIVNHLSVSDVACENGVTIIRSEMEKSPIIKLLEHKEVDRKRQKCMRLTRYAGESLESFINRASIYRHENDQCQNYKVGSKFYLGHLLDAAKLTKKDEALVKTAAGGLHEEGRVVSALLELSEQLEGQPGWPIGRGEPNLHDEDEYLVQKNRYKEGRDRGGEDGRADKNYKHPRGRNGRFTRGKLKGRFKRRCSMPFWRTIATGPPQTTRTQRARGTSRTRVMMILKEPRRLERATREMARPPLRSSLKSTVQRKG